MSSVSNPDPMFWVITADEHAYGPYDDEALARAFAMTNLGLEGWTITQTS